MKNKFEMVIGLEVHVELKTQSKIFCSCPTAFGAEPNTQCCPVCSGMPGTLPVLNKKVVEYAMKAGLATNCTIAHYSKNDRKNYFYPDLPKAYQVSQFDLPICLDGHIDIALDGGEKRIGITRIHIEEDAGKLSHSEQGTLIDLNRSGVPLIEIVSEPDMRSAEEAVLYLKKLRAIILYLGVSDAKMNEGSFRCDVNISVRKTGEEKFGVRSEIKNLNSFAFVAKAIEYEYNRQVTAVENGETLVQETRRFDANSGKTFSMRTKENANDYRYFPDPDLVPIVLTDEDINEVSASLPQLPDVRKAQYISQYGLSAYHSEQLILDKAIADYFEAAAEKTQFPKQVATLIISEIFRLIDVEDLQIPLQPQDLSRIADMLGKNEINNGGAKKIINEIWSNGGTPDELVKSMDLLQLNDPALLAKVIDETIQENPKSVEDYNRGKTAAVKALMGKAMGKTKGKGNPVLLQELLMKALEQ